MSKFYIQLIKNDKQMYKINNNEVKLLNAKEFGLSPRTLFGEFAKDKYVLIKDRKSRIIMKDGRQILDQIEMIKKHINNAEIDIATNAPICGKTTKLFSEKGIKLLQLEK